MKIASSRSIGATLVAAAFMFGLAGEADAQRRTAGAGAARDRSGFSREGSAASGAFSSGRAQQGRQDAQARRQSTSSQNQAQRQDAMSQNQAQRQSAASQNQASRQSTAKQMQSTRSSNVANVQHNYYGDCHDCGDWDDHDAAAGFVVGAVVGGAVVAATQPKTTTVVTTPPPPPAPSQANPPCNIAPVPVNGVPYYKCNATWYAPGYASTGVVYVPVAPPPGY